MMYEFYLATLDGKWGVPYLNRAFFDEVFRTMKDRTLLVLARNRADRPVAGALFFLKDSSLFGRYWGASQQRRNLHFELCYYQAIDFAIEAGLRTPGGRRPGRAQAGARLPAFSHLQRPQDEGSGFRTRYRRVHRVREADARRGHEGVRLPRSLQTLSSPSIAARYYIDTRGWRALLRGGCIAKSSSGLSGRGTVG